MLKNCIKENSDNKEMINLRNLIELSDKTNINIINKNNKLKNKNKILMNCDKIKKKEIKNCSIQLSNLVKLGNSDIKTVKKIYNDLEDKIQTIDTLIEKVYTIKNDEDYIAIYSNCE